MRRSIYEEIGGAPAVAAVIDTFYDRVVADPALTSYFGGRDMSRLKAHQRALVTVALGGGSQQYCGRMMHPAHAGLSITDEAFDKVLEHLLAALTGSGVEPGTATRILAILRPARVDVVQATLVAVK